MLGAISPIVECILLFFCMFVGFKQFSGYFHFCEGVEISVTHTEASRQKSLLFFAQGKDNLS